MAKGPILIDMEASQEPAPSVADAPPVPEPAAPVQPEGAAMQMAARLAARRPSRLVRWFWSALITLLGLVLSVSAWNFVTAWIERYPLLGWAAAGLMGLVIVLGLAMALREAAAFGRLKRLDRLRHDAAEALAGGELKAARAVSSRVAALYADREEARWGRERLSELSRDQVDADGLLAVTERELLGPLDELASREVEAAARQVATVTALVPLAMADVVTALAANMRMIRRIAEVYGGRSGMLGNWRLTRAVLSHLVATGAVAVGDDMLEPLLGGSILGKLSRRFGEGLVNGALTARVGAAAMEVCRPMPFAALERPRARHMVKRALAGMVTKVSGQAAERP